MKNSHVTKQRPITSTLQLTVDSVHKEIDFSKLNWFPNLPTSPENGDFTQFNTARIGPRDIRSILSKCNKKSAPGKKQTFTITMPKKTKDEQDRW